MTERFLGKATSYNDHYMINMGGQKPKLAVIDCWLALICSAAGSTPIPKFDYVFFSYLSQDGYWMSLASL